MGYESKLYIVSKYGVEVASIDMGKMGNYDNWNKLFKKPYKDGLYSIFGGMQIPKEKREFPNQEYIPDIKIVEDRYGDELTYADIDDVIAWCEKNGKQMDYYMVFVLENLLKSLVKYFGFEEFKVVHFGY